MEACGDDLIWDGIRVAAAGREGHVGGDDDGCQARVRWPDRAGARAWVVPVREDYGGAEARS